jgi:hypothetical protein
MLKNRFFSIFAVAGLVSLAACGGGDDAGEQQTEGEVISADTTLTTVTDTMANVTTTTVTADTTVTTDTATTGSDTMQSGTTGTTGADTTARP